MIKIKTLTLIILIAFFSTANSEENFPHYGNLDPKPKIVIKVFSSLTCPHCANFHINFLPKILDKYVLKGKAVVQLMDFPLDLPGLKAAHLQKCMSLEKQKKYLDKIYITQSEWTNAKTLTELVQNLEKITKELGLEGKSIDECLKNKKYEDIVLKSRINAQSKYEINSTPTFVINEKKFKGSIKDLDKYIQKLL